MSTGFTHMRTWLLVELIPRITKEFKGLKLLLLEVPVLEVQRIDAWLRRLQSLIKSPGLVSIEKHTSSFRNQVQPLARPRIEIQVVLTQEPVLLHCESNPSQIADEVLKNVLDTALESKTSKENFMVRSILRYDFSSPQFKALMKPGDIEVSTTPLLERTVKWNGFLCPRFLLQATLAPLLSTPPCFYQSRPSSPEVFNSFITSQQTWSFSLAQSFANQRFLWRCCYQLANLSRTRCLHRRLPLF